MSIRFGSLQKDYDFFISSDSAFIQPPTDGDPSAAADYIAKWRAARETTDYSKVLVPDGQPTKFVLGRVNRSVWRAIQDRSQLPVDSDRHIGYTVVLALLARLAVRSIPSLEMKIDHVADPKWDGWVMAPAALIEQLDETDPRIVAEIGLEALRRLNLTTGDSPS
jgi:hypothetical protein